MRCVGLPELLLYNVWTCDRWQSTINAITHVVLRPNNRFLLWAVVYSLTGFSHYPPRVILCVWGLTLSPPLSPAESLLHCHHADGQSRRHQRSRQANIPRKWQWPEGELQVIKGESHLNLDPTMLFPRLRKGPNSFICPQLIYDWFSHTYNTSVLGI